MPARRAASRPQSRPSEGVPGSGEDAIRLRGVRQNNLRGFDVDIPKGRLVAITGVSGSGKSSLAFDTLYREGQRRFLETLSAYARQFLGRMEKPDLDHVEGLAPAIAVDQKALSRGPRSTVGTLTEIVDYLRVLYARAGTARCPEHGTPLASTTPETVVRQILDRYEGQKMLLLAPLVRDRKGAHKALFEDLARKGFVRARVDGEVHRLEEVPELARYVRHTVEVVIDRIKLAGEEQIARLRESVDQALELGHGDLIAVGEQDEQSFSTLRTCPECDFEAPPLEPRLFSFNSPHGACPTCDGLGVLRRPSPDLVVRDGTLTLREGALSVTRASGGALNFPRVDFDFLDRVAEAYGFDLDTPWNELDREAKRIILHGTGEERFEDNAKWNGKRYKGNVRWDRRYPGVLPALEKAWRSGSRKKLVARYLSEQTCPECQGSRLREVARAVTVGGKRLAELQGAPVSDLPELLDKLPLTKREGQIAEPLLREVRHRLGFLRQVGLEYLTLGRPADSLSGGEAQRIRLAAQLGAGLQGVLYVLDEPSIGLHPRDHGRLLRALFDLRDMGNTVVVVEHDEATLRAADHLIDIGPGAGRHGGHLLGSSAPRDLAGLDSPTGRLLAGKLEMPAPDEPRPGNGNVLRLKGARGFNLKDVDIAIELGVFTAVSGVSGSGKSTLINRTLRPALERHLGREAPEPQDFDGLEGAEHVEELIVIDAAPIGRTPRSNPATYSGAFTPIRDLFAQLPESQVRGWAPGRFSFNVEGGRCEACQGAGSQLVELQFLAPVTVVCEECGGKRFNPETLEAHFKGHSIADVLELTIEDALEVFSDLPKIARPLQALVDVGVGYLSLGQPSTTLSGGEAQRIKLAKQLQRQPRQHTLYMLDEPTTGLHAEDVARLLTALQRLVDGGHSVLVIEHNVDVLLAADRLIDLGPEGGDAGGELVAQGRPEDLIAEPRSYTGLALAHARQVSTDPTGHAKAAAEDSSLRPTPRTHIEVRGARTHNLKGIDVDLPRGALTVITGPSGSGKSSLALDTIHAAGRQRFVESLSTYARQFLSSGDRPPVDRLDGLGPSVSVEAATVRGHPRSTVSTTTEIHDHLRVLWARAGTARCGEHGHLLEPLSPSQAARKALAELEGERGYVLAPLNGTPKDLEARRTAWIQAGFARVMVDGEERRLEQPLGDLPKQARVELVIDRLSFAAKDRSRLAEALEQADALGDGQVGLLTREGRRLDLSLRGACPECGFRWESALEPRHFSFNTHVGACPTCDGLGESWQADPELLIDQPDLPLALKVTGKPTAISGKLGRYLTKGKGYWEHLLRTVAQTHRIDLAKPFERLKPEHRRLLLYGEGARKEYRVEIHKEGAHYELEENFQAKWEGLCGAVNRWYERSEDPEWRGILQTVMNRAACLTCKGERLAPGPRAVTVGRRRLPELLKLSITEAAQWLEKLKLKKGARDKVRPVLQELGARLGLLERVGLGYISLDRSMATLSGGEARRVRLAASLGSQLTGVCYVLDEPTVGLHPSDIDRLAGALEELRDLGNTVLVVEHDEELMRRADYLVDIGPGSGRHGGYVVAAGTPAEVAEVQDSPTGRFLRGEIELPRHDRDLGGDRIGLRGAKLRNLKKVDLTVAYGALTGICGPSGSGKSTLVMDCFVPALKGERPGERWSESVGLLGGDRRVVVVDASPIGRTPKSIPATACGLMDPLRELYSRTPEARMRGMTPSWFSFNSVKGRCPACEGFGATKVEMQFLADLWLTCEECEGLRYRPESRGVKFRGKSIADVLAMSIDEALEFLASQPALAKPLQVLSEVGLGYLALGQSSTTLSVGEAQRLKLATELQRARNAPASVIVLDEPSTGLHATDLAKLVEVLQRLADRGDAVVVIEHHSEVLMACDELIELGPAGGAAGGRLIAQGTPEELYADPESVTGPYLVRRRAKSTDRGSARTALTAGGGKKRPSKKRSAKAQGAMPLNTTPLNTTPLDAKPSRKKTSKADRAAGETDEKSTVAKR
jgi:excinuclease ABC subunit A